MPDRCTKYESSFLLQLRQKLNVALFTSAHLYFPSSPTKAC